MIDYDSLKKHIRFTVQHYGTKTQGEPHRYDQVADYLTEFFIRLRDYDAALQEIDKNYPEAIAAIFTISIK